MADYERAQRALVACSLVCPERLEDVTAALYEAFWVEREAVRTPQTSLPTIADVVGDDLARELGRKVRPGISLPNSL